MPCVPLLGASCRMKIPTPGHPATKTSSKKQTKHANKKPLDSIVFLLFSLTSIAAILYLPHHISLLAGRAWYYINGETIDIAASARDVFGGALGAGKGAAAVVREL